jgi:hypothetical protein
VLEELAVETAYTDVRPTDIDAARVSVIRSECVGLALDFAARGEKSPVVASWLEAAEADPLPEVRLAQPLDGRWITS